MTVLRYLRHHPGRLLGLLGSLSVSVAVVIASGATFTASAANPGNMFAAGNLSIYDSKAGTAILTASAMKPGDVATGTVTIGNTGSTAGTFSLTEDSLSDTAGPNGGLLSAILKLKVEDVTDALNPVVVFNGNSGQFGSLGTVSLGTWAPSAQHDYKFTVTFPDGGTPGSATTGDNAYQSSSVSVRFVWAAVTT
jgi:hypothetical protein